MSFWIFNRRVIKNLKNGTQFNQAGKYNFFPDYLRKKYIEN